MLQLHVQIKAFSQSEEIKNKKFLCGCTHSSCTRAIPKRNEDTFSAKLSHRRTHEPLRVRLPFFIHRESENRNRRQRAWWETRQAAPGVSGLRLTSCPSQRLVLPPSGRRTRQHLEHLEHRLQLRRNDARSRNAHAASRDDGLAAGGWRSRVVVGLRYL